MKGKIPQSDYDLAQQRFEEAQLRAQVSERLSSGQLSGVLSQQRFEQVQQEVGITTVFTSEEEEHVLSELQNQLNSLMPALRANEDYDATIAPLCYQTLSLIHTYLHYRMHAVTQNCEAINAHYYPSNASPQLKLYQHPHAGTVRIHMSFVQYRQKVNTSINSFKSSNNYTQIMAAISHCAPGLLHQPRMLQDILKQSRSSFAHPQTLFFEPPHLDALQNITAAIQDVIDTRAAVDIAAIIHIFSTFNSELSNQAKLNQLDYFICKVLAALETIAKLQPDEVNSRKKNMVRMCLSMGLAVTQYIEYDQLSIATETVEQANKTLADSNSTNEQRTAAIRTLIHSQIPWKLLQNFGLLQFYCGTTKLKRPQTEALIFKQLNRLCQDYQAILPAIKYLIHFEIEAMKGNVVSLPADALIATPLATLTTLGQYGGDLVYALKIKQTLEPLDLNQPLRPQALLRILEVLGECGKNLSDTFTHATKREFWQSVKKCRDLIAHKRSYEHKIAKIFESDAGLTIQIQLELQTLWSACSQFVAQAPKAFADINAIYQGLPPINSPSFTALCERAIAKLTPQDKSDLYNTAQAQITDVEQIRDSILAVINGSMAADQVLQQTFFEWVDSLYSLSNKDRTRLKNGYKNLRSNKPHQVRAAVITKLVDMTTEPTASFQQKVTALADRIHEYKTPQSLAKAVAAIGLSHTLALWEQKRQKCVRSTDTKSTTDSTEEAQSLFEQAESATETLVNQLNLLDQLTRAHRHDLKSFWNNVEICLAAEHHFVLIRQSAIYIQESLIRLQNFQLTDDRQIVLNQLYRLVDGELLSLRLYGNDLAHLHDMTEFEKMTMTPHGNRMILLQQIIAGIDGVKLGHTENPIQLAALKHKIEIYLAQLRKAISKAKPQATNPQRMLQKTPERNTTSNSVTEKTNSLEAKN